MFKQKQSRRSQDKGFVYFLLSWTIYLDWTIDDITGDIRDTRFEIDSRKNVESTAKATFLTVLGAAIFSLAGMILGVVALV